MCPYLALTHITHSHLSSASLLLSSHTQTKHSHLSSASSDSLLLSFYTQTKHLHLSSASLLLSSHTPVTHLHLSPAAPTQHNTEASLNSPLLTHSTTCISTFLWASPHSLKTIQKHLLTRHWLLIQYLTANFTSILHLSR